MIRQKVNSYTGQKDVLIEESPDRCPNCESGIQPIFLSGWKVGERGPLFVAFVCPIVKCSVIFTGCYIYTAGSHHLAKSYLFSSAEHFEFQEGVKKLSPKYCELCCEAKIAEDNNLLLIAGPGYRKALEYLVKDFLIKNKYAKSKEDQERVRKQQLMVCITKDIDEIHIRDCAKRAAWLGNDEVHYTRKWEEKDLQDLKALIRMTENWINLLIESQKMLKEMPEPLKV